MPPISVHLSSPISPTTGLAADGITPSTATDDKQSTGPGDSQIPAATPATTTGLALLSASNVQPGACAVPVPTSPAAPNSTRYIPTRTVPAPSAQAFSSPPPPQPGPAPSPFQLHPAQLDRRHPTVPPPPKGGEIPKTPSEDSPQYEASSTTTPTLSSPAPPPPLPYHQEEPNYSTPARAQPPASLTSTPHDLSHPPGYVQDSRTSFEERPIEPYQPFANWSNHKPTPSKSGAGILDEIPENQPRMEGEENSLWGDAVSWAKTIGGKVIEGEEALWKRINSRR